jgi:lysozyme
MNILKPIIYATEKDYDIYLSGYYETYDIWIRNVFTRPKELKDQVWTFWQYSNRGRLNGYAGEERYIDLNVFHGTLEEFYSYEWNVFPREEMEGYSDPLME